MRKILLLVGLCSLILPMLVSAHVGPRLSVEVDKKIVKGLSASVEGEYRWKDGFAYTDRISGTFGLDYKVNKYLKTGIAYALLHKRVNYVKEWKNDTASLNYWQNRNRFIVYATGSYKFSDFKLSLRERFQYTMWDKTKLRRLKDEYGDNVKDENGNKVNEQYKVSNYKPLLRSRLQLAYAPKKVKFSPYIGVEFFNLLDPKTDYDEFEGGTYDKNSDGSYTNVGDGNGSYIKTTEKSLDEIRYSVGIEYKVAKGHEISLYYNYCDLKNDESDDDDVKHQIGLSYSFSF